MKDKWAAQLRKSKKILVAATPWKQHPKPQFCGTETVTLAIGNSENHTEISGVDRTDETPGSRLPHTRDSQEHQRLPQNCGRKRHHTLVGANLRQQEARLNPAVKSPKRVEQPTHNRTIVQQSLPQKVVHRFLELESQLQNLKNI